MITRGWLLGLLVLTAATFAQVSKGDIDRAIDSKALKHPYLLFSEDEKPNIRQRIEAEGSRMARLVRQVSEDA